MASENTCPFHHAAGGGTTNTDWWPNQLRVDLLNQHSGRSNPLGQTFDYAKEFNKLSDEKRWQVLDKALKGFDFAIKDFEKSWEAQESTLQDYIKEAQRALGKPIFDQMKAIGLPPSNLPARSRDQTISSAEKGEPSCHKSETFPRTRPRRASIAGWTAPGPRWRR